MHFTSDQSLEPHHGIRRDCIPHRGYDLKFQAKVALVFGVLSVFTCLPGLIAIPWGLYVLYAAESDLDKINADLMDKRGTPETQAACRIGGLAALCAFVGISVFGLLIAVVLCLGDR